jgi:hypothetical protein
MMGGVILCGFMGGVMSYVPTFQCLACRLNFVQVFEDLCMLLP